MAALNYARDVRIGDGPVRAVALGGNFVWPPLPERLIRTLYGNGEQGAMYIPEPKVLGQQVLWQDSAGTVPVVADGDPVGLMLDKSRGLELGLDEFSALAPGIADQGSAGAWDGVTKTLSNSAVGTSGSYPRFSFVHSAKSYWRVWRFSFAGDVESIGFVGATSAGGIAYRASEGADFSSTLEVFIPPDTPGSLQVFCDGTSIFEVTINATLKEIRGNHATQSTSAARPVYRTDGELHWLEGDGVDDALSTPAVLPIRRGCLAASSHAVVGQDGAAGSVPLFVASSSATTRFGSGEYRTDGAARRMTGVLRISGGTPNSTIYTDSDYIAGQAFTAIWRWRSSDDQLLLRSSAITDRVTSSTYGTTEILSQRLTIFSGFPVTARFFCGIYVDGHEDSALAGINEYLAMRAGVTL